jgi:hypothetical protein
MEHGAIDVFGGPPRLIVYDLIGGDPITQHDFGSSRPLGVGDSFLMDREQWVIREVGPPLSREKAGALFCDVEPVYGPNVFAIGAI